MQTQGIVFFSVLIIIHNATGSFIPEIVGELKNDKMLNVKLYRYDIDRI